MKLARFTADGRTSIGIIHRNQVIEIARLDPGAPHTIRELLAAGVAGRARIACAISRASSGPPPRLGTSAPV